MKCIHPVIPAKTGIHNTGKLLHGYLLANDELILKALGEGVKAALKQNKLAGNSVACWKDGKVVELKAEEIPDLD